MNRFTQLSSFTQPASERAKNAIWIGNCCGRCEGVKTTARYCRDPAAALAELACLSASARLEQLNTDVITESMIVFRFAGVKQNVRKAIRSRQIPEYGGYGGPPAELAFRPRSAVAQFPT